MIEFSGISRDTKDFGIVRSFVQDNDLYGVLATFHDQQGSALDGMRPRYHQKHDPNNVFGWGEFVTLVGADVSHYAHPIIQHHVGKIMLQSEQQHSGFDELDAEGMTVEDVELALVIHDIGEVVTGDVPVGPKQDSDEAEEADAFFVVSKSLGVESDRIKRAHEIVFGDIGNSAVSAFFKGTEYVNYIRTALWCSQLLEYRGEFLPWQKNLVLANIVVDVAHNSELFMTQLAKRFASFEEYMDSVWPIVCLARDSSSQIVSSFSNRTGFVKTYNPRKQLHPVG